MRPLVPILIAIGIVLAASGTAPAAVSYMLDYANVPATVAYVEQDLKTGVQESQEEGAGMGSIGFRLGAGIAPLGPFSLAIESGFGLPAGSQTFAHTLMVRNTAGETRERKNDGDFTVWEIMTVPLLIKLRYAPPVDAVSLMGDVAVGAMFLGVNTERTTAVYDATDTLTLRETADWQETKIAMAIEVNGGVAVPVAEALRVELTAGILWMSDVPAGVSRTSPSPQVIYGYSGNGPAAPVLQLGGIGFGARIGLTAGL